MEITITQGNNESSRASRAPSNSTAKRTASGQRTSTQRSAAGQRSASSQRPASSQRSTSGQRPASSQRSGAQYSSGQRPSGQRPGGQRPTSGQGGRNRKKKRGVSPVLIVLIVALVLAIAVFAGIGVYAMQYVNYDKILPNVYVAGIDVGGMTVDEATAVIEASLSETEQQSVRVILPDQVLTFTPEQDTVLIDVDQAVAAAYSYGRASTNPFAMSRAIKAAQRRRNDIDISTAVEVDTDYIRSLIDTTAQDITTPLVDSTVKADEEAHTITVTIGTPGKELDTDTLYTLVSTAFSTGDYSDISFDYTMTYPATVALDTLYAQMTIEPTDAKYNSDTGEVDAEVVGYTPSVDLDKANEQLAMAAAGETLVFTFDETPANITKDELEPMLFRDKLYSYGSVYDSSNSGRTTNLRLACEAIDGTVLQPGEVFSFNDVVGERTAEKGYKEATVYVSGDSVPALGGGICQVASTIYYCCMYADLEIVEREEHMFFVTYVPGGLDATVYWGSQDFQFKNSTDYPLRVDAYLSNGRVQIELWGTDVNDYTIEIDSNKISTTNFESIVKEGTGTDQSGYTGYVYEIVRRVYDSNGNLIRTDTTADLDNMGGLGTSTYNKRDKVTYTGTSSSSSSGRDDDDDEPTTQPSTSPSTSPSTQPSTEPSQPADTLPPVSQEPETPATTAPDVVTPAPDVPTETNVDSEE